MTLTARAVDIRFATDGDVAALRAEVAALRLDLSALRARVEQLERTRLSRPVRARVVPLLAALAGIYGSSLFTASDVISHEDAGLRLVCRGLNAKKLGWLLSRADGIVCGGYVVTAEVEKRHQWFWSVRASR